MRFIDDGSQLIVRKTNFGGVEITKRNEGGATSFFLYTMADVAGLRDEIDDFLAAQLPLVNAQNDRERIGTGDDESPQK